MTSILIIDDDVKICLFFSKLIKQMGHDFKIGHSLEEGMKLMADDSFDLILLDLELPDGNGLDVLPELLQAPSEPEVIIITGTGDIRGAELAFKYGAWDYVQKPFLMDEVMLPITRALQYRKEKKTDTRWVSIERSNIIGDSKQLQRCLSEVAKAAASDVSVLITGETGTGKELFARAIHNNSHRAGKPFVAVDCGALPETLVESTLFGHEKGAFTGAVNMQEGLIRQANHGTLLLDEVGDLPLPAQKSLLRTLQERKVRMVGGTTTHEVDIRLVAATHLNLEGMVKQNQFREDFFYRIRAMEIKLPPLRDRENDIEEVVIKKSHDLTRRYGIDSKAISPEFLTILKHHQWPGNIRELINVMEYALAAAGDDPTLIPKHLPFEYRLSKLDFPEKRLQPEALNNNELLFGLTDLPTLTDYRDKLEKTYLKELLNRADGDREAACRISGVSQSRLYGLLKKHDLAGFR